MNAGTLNIHAIIPDSMVNGPGRRMVVFFQGCGRGCPGCFNPETHPFGPRELLTVEEILGRLPTGPVEGITVSGGEPFMQPEGLYRLLEAAGRRGLTTVVYTGFRLAELKGRAAECLEHMDVLIDGGYEEAKAEPTLLARGSSNQEFRFLTPRYSIGDFIMPGKVEVTIGPGGVITETGFSQLPLSSDK
ncbi:MAG: 4Fe-4S single cluster domain-containing protein [Deltaproteobacteria bacterium]|nr:4Fe-4S single cluster domain-containing protein [Deltaproteobacteria bacterium]